MDGLSKLRMAAGGVAASLSEFASSPEAKELGDMASELARDAAELAKKGAKETERRWPEIRQRIGQLADRLRQAGHEEQARELEKLDD